MRANCTHAHAAPRLLTLLMPQKPLKKVKAKKPLPQRKLQKAKRNTQKGGACRAARATPGGRPYQRKPTERARQTPLTPQSASPPARIARQ